MLQIRYVEDNDRAFWLGLDKHLPETEFLRKVQTKSGYVAWLDGQPVGILRYNLFWDNMPFCTMLFVDEAYQGKGYGKRLMQHWEADMKAQGYGMVLTSTRADEAAQHFYRKLGYLDCGGLLLSILGEPQPTELFFAKTV